MKQYHLIGMGVLGSFFAWELFKAKRPFTWNDTDETHVAWKASTGLIYPSGDAQEAKAYRQWSLWHQRDAPWLAHIGRMSEAGAFWFNSKRPPHGATYDIIDHVDTLYLGAYPSYHLNVQQFVQETRTFFAAYRTPDPPQKGQCIVSHGFSMLCDHYVWGWSRRVKLHIDARLHALSTNRPTFYLREHRFQFAYANLVATTPYYYAGSAMISQKTQAHYTTDPKYIAWEKLFTRLSGDMITVAEEDEPILQGWRPTMEKEGKHHFYAHNGVYYAPAMSGSGVRLAPLLCAEFRSLL